MPTDNSASSQLSKLYAKAVTRTEKLEKTLAKIIARNEPRSDIEVLLKDLRRGLKILRKGEITPLPASDGSGRTDGQTKVDGNEAAAAPAPETPKVVRRAGASRKTAGKSAAKPRTTRARPKAL